MENERIDPESWIKEHTTPVKPFSILYPLDLIQLSFFFSLSFSRSAFVQNSFEFLVICFTVWFVYRISCFKYITLPLRYSVVFLVVFFHMWTISTTNLSFFVLLSWFLLFSRFFFGLFFVWFGLLCWYIFLFASIFFCWFHSKQYRFYCCECAQHRVRVSRDDGDDQ